MRETTYNRVQTAVEWHPWRHCADARSARPEPIHRDGAREHGQLVQLALVGTPVVPVLPLIGKSLGVCKRSHLVPFTSSGRRVSSSLHLSSARASSGTEMWKV